MHLIYCDGLSKIATMIHQGRTLSSYYSPPASLVMAKPVGSVSRTLAEDAAFSGISKQNLRAIFLT